MAAENVCIVLDNGSHSCKAGFATEDVPTVDLRTVVTKPIEGEEQYDPFIGREAFDRSSALKIAYPMQFGLITNWDFMQKIWDHIFLKELKVDPEECSFLITQHSRTPKYNTEKLAQVMFETYNIPLLCVGNTDVLALISSGLTTGLVLSSGESISYTVPIYEGHALRHTIGHLDIGGRNLTDYMMNYLCRERGCKFTTSKDRRYVNDHIKEKVCYISLNQLQNAPLQQSEIELPDGHKVCLDKERHLCPEAIFDPSILGFEMPGLHEIALNSIRKCPQDLQSSMTSNIVLTGGNFSFPNLQKRMQYELSQRIDSQVQVKESPNFKYASWIGGSVVGMLPNFYDYCMTKYEYDEYGPERTNSRFF